MAEVENTDNSNTQPAEDPLQTPKKYEAESTPRSNQKKRSPARRSPAPNIWAEPVSPKEQKLASVRLANGLSSTGRPPKSLNITASSEDLRVVPVRDPYNALSASWTHPSPKKIPDGPPANEDRLIAYSNADYWMKRNKSPKHKDIAEKEKKAQEKQRETNLSKQAPGSFTSWAESKAQPKHSTKKFKDSDKEAKDEEAKAQQAKLEAQPGPDTQTWVANQSRPKALQVTKYKLPPPEKYDPRKEEEQKRKEREALIQAKPPESSLDWVKNHSPPPGKKFSQRAQEETEAEMKARKKRLAAQPPASTTSWIDDNSSPVERPNVTLREWPEWGNDPKWKKKKPQA